VSTPEARGGRSFAADPIVEAPGELPQVWAAQLVSCVVDENVGLPDTAVLTYRDPTTSSWGRAASPSAHRCGCR